MRTPDWYRRLRALERRIDNQSTDIARLWNWAPQMPEQPGHFMPQIVPGTTAPPSTTTTTSTSTTTTSTSTTSTTSTTTTGPPLTCRSGWPTTVTLSASGFTGIQSWMNPSSNTNVNGTHLMQYYTCSYSADGGAGYGLAGAGRWINYQGPAFLTTAGYIGIRWGLTFHLKDSDRSSVVGIYSPTIEFDRYGVFAWVNAAFSTALYYSDPEDQILSDCAPNVLYPTGSVGASIICGRSFSLVPNVNRQINNEDWYTWPSSISIQFSTSQLP